MDATEFFSPDYATARERFRIAATRLGWWLESIPIGCCGPDGKELTVDVAGSQNTESDQSLVLSSGVHGVEGFFGSAVQLALLDQWASGTAPIIRCVLLHGLNPYGFAWLRRFDEHNVDPNRNFLLAGEQFAGSPPGYAELDSLLNPHQPPSACEPFTLKALLAIARRGMPALRQSVASGQYEFPLGLFFGGKEPAPTNQIVTDHLCRWLEGSRQVVHLDFHTGLGRRGVCKLLIDYQLTGAQRANLVEWFGADSFESLDDSTIAYDARGGLGRWCASSNLAPHYLFACAEFGTYGPIAVIAGLRGENQAYHWGAPSDASTIRAKERLRELFCPAAADWRTTVVSKSMDLVDRAIRGMQSARFQTADAADLPQDK